jgi:hypothetical protein
MGFKDFVAAAKKNSVPQKTPSIGTQQNIIDASEAPSAQKAAKQDISYRDSEIQGFVPQQRSSMGRTNVDARCGSIIRNIASESNMSSQMGGDATWENCRHRKTNSGRDYCAEYHSLCAKHSCRRARR